MSLEEIKKLIKDNKEKQELLKTQIEENINKQAEEYLKSIGKRILHLMNYATSNAEVYIAFNQALTNNDFSHDGIEKLLTNAPDLLNELKKFGESITQFKQDLIKTIENNTASNAMKIMQSTMERLKKETENETSQSINQIKNETRKAINQLQSENIHSKVSTQGLQEKIIDSKPNMIDSKPNVITSKSLQEYYDNNNYPTYNKIITEYSQAFKDKNRNEIMQNIDELLNELDLRAKRGILLSYIKQEKIISINDFNNKFKKVNKLEKILNELRIDRHIILTNTEIKSLRPTQAMIKDYLTKNPESSNERICAYFASEYSYAHSEDVTRYVKDVLKTIQKGTKNVQSKQ